MVILKLRRIYTDDYLRKNDLLTRDKLPAYTIIKNGEKVGILQKMKSGKWEFDSVKYNIVGETFGSVGSAKRYIEGVMGK